MRRNWRKPKEFRFWRNGVPQLSEYAVEPVGVEMIKPSPQ